MEAKREKLERCICGGMPRYNPLLRCYEHKGRNHYLSGPQLEHQEDARHRWCLMICFLRSVVENRMMVDLSRARAAVAATRVWRPPTRGSLGR